MSFVTECPRRRMSRPPSPVFAGLFAAALALCAGEARAQSATEGFDFTIHQHYLSTRALGMGNAFTAVADDHSAMFYNPAGLARLDDWRMNFNLGGMIDKDVRGLVDDIEAASKAGDNIARINQILTENYGKHFSSRVPTLGWQWVWPRWGVAVIPADLNLEMEMHQTAGPAAQVVATQDSTVAFSYARSPKWFRRHKVSWGVTTKAIYRAYFNRSLNAVDFALESDVVKLENAAEGFTVDADAGLLFTPDTKGRGFWGWSPFKFLRPTFGLAVRNIADYGFGSDFNLYTKTASAKPPRLERRLDLGTMWELPDWWVFKSRFAFDVRDIGHSQWTFRKGLHTGVEFNWKLFGWWQGGWRAGVNQGYLTVGFTGKLGVFQLDLATYGEEVGSSETKNESRRYMAKASFDF